MPKPPVHIPAPPEFKKKMLSVGITGTNGKTSTTAWVAAALSARQAPVARSTTVGLFLDDEELDLPKSYQGFIQAMRRCVDAGGRFAAIELTSEALMLGFGKAWPTEIGVFTNLSHDHLDAHKSPEHYLASKAQLFLNIPAGGTAILNGCDPTSELLAGVLPEGVAALYYGAPTRGEPIAPLDLEATHVRVDWDGTTVDLRASEAFPDAPSQLRVPAVGAIYAENAMAAFAAAAVAGVPSQDAAAALAKAPAPPGRFEIVVREPYVVVDFAHTPDALERTLRAARELCKGELWVVFGAGGNRDQDKRAPMGAAAAACDHVVLTSDNPRDEDAREIARQIREGIPEDTDVRIELDRRRAIALAMEKQSARDVVVVAGRGHETEQTIAGDNRPLSDVDVVRSLR